MFCNSETFSTVGVVHDSHLATSAEKEIVDMLIITGGPIIRAFLQGRV
jgi:hypothetical protein